MMAGAFFVVGETPRPPAAAPRPGSRVPSSFLLAAWSGLRSGCHGVCSNK